MIAFGFNSWEFIVILLVVLLLFGNRLPSVARSLGSGITEFKKGLREGNDKNEKPPANTNSGGTQPPQS